MNKLYRHNLEFERTLLFVKDNLYDVNALSSEVLKSVNFSSGMFYTLLPFGSNLNRLYEFEAGGILPQNPIIETEDNGKKYRHSITPTIKEELSEFIFDKINTNVEISCVFDDVLRTPQSPHLKLFNEKKALYLYKNEVIYIIEKENNTSEFILECIWKSFALWHSVGVLTEANCFDLKENNILSLDNIRNICEKTITMMISAYDGEGYVLWEKIDV